MYGGDCGRHPEPRQVGPPSEPPGVHCRSGPPMRPKSAPPSSSGHPVLTVDSSGRREWKLDGDLHRDDGPAVRLPDGTTEWWRHGRPHRVGAPAVESADGTLEW